MTVKELAKKLTAGMYRTINGFYCNGIFYNGYTVIDETTIEFHFARLSYVGADVFCKTRLNINQIQGIETIKVYNEREGYKTPYNNVILKA